MTTVQCKNRSCFRSVPLGRIGALLLVLAASAATQPQWSDQFDRPGVNGRVFGLGNYNGMLVAGGYYDHFETDGKLIDHVAGFDGTNWTNFGAGVNGPVRAVATYNGDLIIAGQFGLAGGQRVYSIARWDGSQWHPLGEGLDLSWDPVDGAEVWDLVVYRGDLYAGGQFDTAGGQPVNLIARWDGTNWHQVGSGLGSSQLYPKVLSLVVTSDDRLVAAGEFDTAGGKSAVNIAAFDGTSWSSLGSGLGREWSSVFAVKEFQGDIYAGGNFSTAGGIPAEKIARWDGSSWYPLRAGIPDYPVSVEVKALEVFQNKLYVGGDFVFVDGLNNISASRIATWDGQQWEGFGGVSGMDLATHVGELEVIGDLLYLGGEFTVGSRDFAVGNTVVSHDVIAFDGTDYVQVGKGLGGHGGKLLHWNGGVVCVGNFIEAGRSYSPYLAFFDGDDWVPLAVFSQSGRINDALVWNGDLIVTGQFTTIDGQEIQRMARFDGTTWSGFGSGIGGNAVTIYRDQLYVGGLGHVHRWNGTDWEKISDQISGDVYDLEVFQDKLYIGGYLNVFSGGPRHLLVYDGQTVQGVSNGTDEAVHQLLAHNGELLVGGRFKTVGGGIDAPLFARWTGAEWKAWPGQRFGGSVVSAIEVFGGEVHVGGHLNQYSGGRSDDWLVRWDGSAWIGVGNSTGLTGQPLSLLGDDDKGHLWAAGGFLFADGLPSFGIARWETQPSSCDASWSLYGEGWPGTGGGVPATSLTTKPYLGTTVSMRVTNSRGQTTSGTILIGSRDGSDVTRWGGTLLVQPLITISVPVPMPQLVFPFSIPDNGALCGRSLYVQTVIADPGASRGLAFTPGLHMIFGR